MRNRFVIETMSGATGPYFQRKTIKGAADIARKLGKDTGPSIVDTYADRDYTYVDRKGIRHEIRAESHPALPIGGK